MKKNKNKIALWIGRFQPFHIGHLHVLKMILSEYEFVTIVVGSAQEDYTIRNPLTAKERKNMIEKVMRSYGVEKSRFKIFLADDIVTNSLWANYIAKKVGRFDKVVTANALTRILFSDSGFEVDKHHLFNRRVFSGTEVRKRITNGKDWSSLVPPTVFVDLQKIDIENRIRNIQESDNPYV